MEFGLRRDMIIGVYIILSADPAPISCTYVWYGIRGTPSDPRAIILLLCLTKLKSNIPENLETQENSVIRRKGKAEIFLAFY